MIRWCVHLAFAMIVALSGAAFAQSSDETANEAASSEGATPLFYYAGAPGRLTTDRDARGGNPFASALVEVLKTEALTLGSFGMKLAAANATFSNGWQQAQLPKALAEPQMRFGGEAGDKRVALVLINADYSKSDGVYSLPGARFDAQRVPEALRAAGFETTVVLDANAAEAREAMAAFGVRSRTADTSVVYVGGHGVQHKRVVYWMMGDYPGKTAAWLSSHAISLDEVGKAGQARRANLVLYASCRDDPFR